VASNQRGGFVSRDLKLFLSFWWYCYCSLSAFIAVPAQRFNTYRIALNIHTYNTVLYIDLAHSSLSALSYTLESRTCSSETLWVPLTMVRQEKETEFPASGQTCLISTSYCGTLAEEQSCGSRRRYHITDGSRNAVYSQNNQYSRSKADRFSATEAIFGHVLSTLVTTFVSSLPSPSQSPTVFLRTRFTRFVESVQCRQYLSTLEFEQQECCHLLYSLHRLHCATYTKCVLLLLPYFGTCSPTPILIRLPASRVDDRFKTAW
jgi:hypothetical protein